MAASIGSGNSPQINNPSCHLPLGYDPDCNPGERDHQERQDKICADVKIGRAEKARPSHRKTGIDIFPEKRGGGVVPYVARVVFGGIDVGIVAITGMAEQGIGDFFSVRCQNPAIAVENGDDRTPRQRARAHHKIEPTDIDGDTDCADEMPRIVAQREHSQHGPPVGT